MFELQMEGTSQICFQHEVSGAPKNLSLPSAERAQATEQRYNKLKDKHTELVADHADLLRKVLTHSLSSPLAH